MCIYQQITPYNHATVIPSLKYLTVKPFWEHIYSNVTGNIDDENNSMFAFKGNVTIYCNVLVYVNFFQRWYS